MRTTLVVLAVAILAASSLLAQTPTAPPTVTILKPARVFDGDAVHEGWAVRVKGDRIDAVGSPESVAADGAKIIDLPGTTLTPGLVEGHSHILLHSYAETSWTDQVSREGLALRVARAVNHLRDTLQAGFTTVRDLGTEGAGYADVELKQAVNQGIVPGPRILATTRAIVATGSYQPKFIRVVGAAGRRRSRWRRPPDERRARSDRARRRLDQDVRRLPVGTAVGIAPDLLDRGAEAGRRDGKECRRAGGGPRQHRRGDAARGAGERGNDRPRRRRHARSLQADGRAPRRAVPDHHRRLRSVAAGRSQLAGAGAQARQLQGRALAAGVTILNGSDVGTFPHGENAREIEAMVAYGYRPSMR